MLRVIFCGDRHWTDYGRILIVMQRLKNNLGDFVVIEGEARGADLLSKYAAKCLPLPHEEFPANWDLHGKAAGPIRNTQMLKSPAHGIVAFHDHLSDSKGTKNMVEQGLKAGIPVWVSQQDDASLMLFMLQLRRKTNVCT